ncbi:uncharacterized protein KY384_008259 [Bacidia gigantensis]|uniref:uncharacterized protein n=1 Tax=Bacidia gigantensis TaxID=2732470 RepID=UPI001D040E56|nr:uncharacterized protein KY384_008259 [Bacidia gigantensis]KAG8526830.1 hypothetical protein KY384_008259 [Bacidia gigantensis]
MAEVVVPQLSLSPLGPSGNRDSLDSPPPRMNHVESTSSNDAFIFQPLSGLSPLPHVLGHRQTTSSVGITSHRRKPSNLSLSTLAPFEFGTTTKESLTRPLPSPTRSPARLTPPGNHVSGHKRGGSEFVGGDITHGGPVLVTKNLPQDEDSGALPSSPNKGSLPTGRGRHSHRRSGAVSQGDIRMIMQPSKEQKADSAPQTPALSRPHQPPGPERSSSLPSQAGESNGRSATPPRTLQPEAGQSRTRVGFSDAVDFISRPLSTISSETSSSMSTVRAHHSFSESVEHQGNRGASSPPSYISSGSSETYSSREERSATDAVLRSHDDSDEGLGDERGSQRLHAFNKDLPITSHAHNQRHQGLDLCTTEVSVQADAFDGRPSNPWDNISTLPFEGPSIDSLRPHSISDPHFPRPRTSPESKSSNRQQKVKSWADTILHRKDRQAPKDAIPLPHTFRPSALDEPEAFTLDDVNFDDDTTLVMIEDLDTNSLGQVRQNLNVSNLQSGQLSPVSEQSSSSPMLDLDAALDSFSSPNDDPASINYFNRSSVGTRLLHSSGETGGFMGPGMHYHRRADSAPEIETPERPRLGIPRLGSNSKMEAAIEEEEEDVELDEKRRGEQVLGLGVNVVDCEATSEEPLQRRTSSTSADKRRNRRTAVDSVAIHDTVEIVEAEEEPRYSSLTKSSDESTITPTLSPDASSYNPASGPFDSALPTPSLTYGTTPETPSAVSSADYHKTSFDVHDPRIHTASSSVTGVTLDSSKITSHGAVSIEDVPSLTSSASTMLSGHPDRFSSSGNTFYSTDRSASLSAAVPARTKLYNSSKRSSLASLSKLVGGSYNKSKLNIAETLPPDTPERKSKKKNRISRMMKFWKSKEKLTPG